MLTDSFSNNRVLVVDDNVGIHEDFRKILNPQRNEALDELERNLFQDVNATKYYDYPFEVHFATQGQEGFKKVQESINNNLPFAVVFIDIRMPPGWNGIETAKRIWNIDPDLEMVFCSAHSDFTLYDIHQELPQKNDFLLIQKPFEIIEIKQTAISLCKKWSLNHKLKSRLEEVQDQLLLADKLASLGQLAAGVAHEINNPVGYISSNLNTLKKYTQHLLELIDIYQKGEALAPSNNVLIQKIKNFKQQIDIDFLKQDIVDLIKESCEGVARVKKIVQDLKDFSRSTEKEWGTYHLNLGMDSTLNIVQTELKYKARIIKDYESIPAIQAVGSQINQVILNLLINAGQAIENSGTITIQTRQVGDRVVFKIKDTGKGIDPKNINKIFDPFFTTKPIGQGTGLGLALSYGIIQSHDGIIKVESQVGQGTTFTVELPIQQKKEKVHPVNVGFISHDR